MNVAFAEPPLSLLQNNLPVANYIYTFHLCFYRSLDRAQRKHTVQIHIGQNQTLFINKYMTKIKQLGCN